MLPRRRLFDLDLVDLPSLEPLVDELAAFEPVPLADGDPLPCVVTPNVDHVVKLDRRLDATTNRVVDRALYVLPDGQPIVWASRILGEPLGARLTGSDLVAALWPRLVADGRPTLVVASSEAIAHDVEAEGSTFHAVVAPMLSAEDPAATARFVDGCADAVRRHRPDYVFVTLGFPRQYHVIDGLLERLAADEPVPMMLAVGASFDMHYGHVRRAPEWMQRWGLEWLHRFLKEPRRLFRRYFVEDPAFLRIVWRERSRRR